MPRPAAFMAACNPSRLPMAGTRETGVLEDPDELVVIDLAPGGDLGSLGCEAHALGDLVLGGNSYIAYGFVHGVPSVLLLSDDRIVAPSHTVIHTIVPQDR